MDPIDPPVVVARAARRKRNKHKQDNVTATTEGGDLNSATLRDADKPVSSTSVSLSVGDKKHHQQGGMLGDVQASASVPKFPTSGDKGVPVSIDASPPSARSAEKKRNKKIGGIHRTSAPAAGNSPAQEATERSLISTTSSANSRNMKRHKQGGVQNGASTCSSAADLVQSNDVDRNALQETAGYGKPGPDKQTGVIKGVSFSALTENLTSPQEPGGAVYVQQTSPRGGKKGKKQRGVPNGTSASASAENLEPHEETGDISQHTAPRSGSKVRPKQSKIPDEKFTSPSADNVASTNDWADSTENLASPSNARKNRKKNKASAQETSLFSSGEPPRVLSNPRTKTVIAAAVPLPVEFQNSDETYDFADLNKDWRARSSANPSVRGGRRTGRGNQKTTPVHDASSSGSVRRVISNQNLSNKKEPIEQRPATAGHASSVYDTAMNHKQGRFPPGGNSQNHTHGSSARQKRSGDVEYEQSGGSRYNSRQGHSANANALQAHDRSANDDARRGGNPVANFVPTGKSFKGTPRPQRSGPLDDPWKGLMPSTDGTSNRDTWKDPPRTTQFNNRHSTSARESKTWGASGNAHFSGREQSGIRPPSGGRQLWTDDHRGKSSPRSSGKALFYEEHMSLDAVQKGLAAGTLHQGSLRINKRNRFDAYVTLVNQTTDNDIYLCGVKNRNRALDGDIVALRILEGEELQLEMSIENGRQEKKRVANDERQAKCDVIEHDIDLDSETCLPEAGPEDQALKEEKRIYGKVVHILERRVDQNFAGTLGFDMPNGQSRDRASTGGRDRAPKILWFKPTDKRAPLMAIPVEDVPKEFLQDPAAYSEILFKANVRKWSAASQYPFGIVTGTLGQMGEISVESAALLTDAGVVWDEFSDEVLACLPALPWQIPAAEYEKRRDFRDERIFSIDPPTARDLDDAVSVKALGDGIFEIGVHIADVGFFVKPDSALDKEARYRATTVYLVQRAIPMLPRLLCEELCSLNPGVERLAFSVTWRMDASARVLGEPWFGRSIIKSCAKLSYDHAQRLIEGQGWEGLPKVELSGNSTIDDIKADTLRLYEFSRMMRKRRFEEGALSMQNIKLSFGIDEYGNPISVGVYQIKDSNKLIEEFMLLANMAVAQKIAARFPDAAMLRNHAAPKARGMTEFVDFAAQLGYKIDAESSSSLQKSFEAITDPEKRIVMRQLCIKPMQRAKYFSTGSLDIKAWHHFALNVPLYTHFTSPIRRYCDLMVHRMLEMVCDGTPGQLYENKEVASVSKHCNGRKESSKEAQEASQKLYLCAYLTKLGARNAESHAKPGVLTEGIVHKVGPRSFDVLIQEFGIEKRIWIEDAIDSGEAVGVDAIPGNVPGLRILWTKKGAADVEKLADGVQQLKLEDGAAAQSSTGQGKSDSAKNLGQKRRYDPKAVVEQTVRVFDVVIVRVIPEISRSPPEFRILPEHPDGCRDYAAAAQHQRDLVRGDLAAGMRESCPAAAEDAE
ncbi:hypothetical protein HDU86_004893 [Geranomyces michiganensis]|nr:hypothetical protein HDU86_004893 [Geranomyces michiganensis]